MTSDKEAWLDDLADIFLRGGLPPDRLMPLLESAALRQFAAGQMLFEQFHPASEFYLLGSGTAIRAGAGALRTNLVRYESIDWPYAALGWSGFIAPRRYGSTVTARSDVAVLNWNHAQLARFFYADPSLSVCVLDLVLDSVRQQLRALREQRIAATTSLVEPPLPMEPVSRRPVVGRADSCLRRSAFFSAFDEATIDRLAARAELESWNPGQRIVRQDEEIDSLLLLAAGRCNLFFEQGAEDDVRLLPFRRFRNRYGIIAGIPQLGHRFVAEASVYAEGHCWIYRLPGAAIRDLVGTDPELGRTFQQRLLVRMAGWVGAMQVVRDVEEDEPEVTAVANTVANSRARLPVTSELHKVPHLLAHRLTIANAFAVLKNVSETGRYHERLLAARCNDLIADLAAEDAFYRTILQACEQVIAADETASAEAVRAACDAMVDRAFSFLDCRISGKEQLPDAGGNIVIMNHLVCPEYYELPNQYHFSFDTAFVSCLVWRHFGKSAVRVVRESPDAEFGHSLFYRRLGHIFVPTIESDVDGVSEAEFAARRRAAGKVFAKQGLAVLEAGGNLVICPEGQSQAAIHSPARFHSGAFRLAAESGADIVPIALAGFDRRYKDGPLVAVIGRPVNVAAEVASGSCATIREFADAFRRVFANDVARAMTAAAEPVRLSHPGG